MKTRSFFIMALLCLVFSACLAQSQPLKTKISLKVNNATLPQVLQSIQQKYAIRFSYLNNDLPPKNRVSAEIQDKTLAEVLDVLLANTNVGYLEKNGQVIIKKGLPKSLPKASTLNKLPPPTSSTPAKPTPRTTPTPAEVKPEPTQKKVETVVTPPSTSAAEEPASVPDTLATQSVSDTSAARTSITIKRVKTIAFDEDSLEIKPYHLGIIYPLSTNGTRANEYVNRVSAHLLVGTAAGNQGAEFAGIGNIDKKYVRGFQFGGYFNIIGNRDKLTPVTDSVINRYSLQGGQFAGFLNVASGNSNGVQFAGFLNVSRNITGVQGAGFMNIARDVKGAQLSGFINKARYVRGTQIGFLNFADSINGVPVGFLSFVKHGGYHHAEIYVADDFNVNITYKIGVPKFYTLFALGAELDDKKRWGYGAGFGSEWTLYKRLHLNTDVVSYYVIEKSYENFPDGLFEDYELNMLNKFRLLGTVQLANHLSFFGGPTFNVMVSKYQEPGESEVGSTFPKHTFFNKTDFFDTNVKMWIGFNAGIRF
ncbi:hypothetical protein AHMF7605_09470 [Adhaeribacter arboris]|uniref:Protein FecR C-terminal domain-containing protein n=1 Tax=Adhaeribacter arboris TaxID=2072846 RepID=A0A2T2YDZ9_9BACT|nr:DUF4974 domain-containing protein [Adhaeribacter arboris]PSR53737.1 hypothetical protein AHMF7605_09470 [Adhaeribacter arboris]